MSTLSPALTPLSSLGVGVHTAHNGSTGQCCCPAVCHPGTDNDPTYAMAQQQGGRDASPPPEYIGPLRFQRRHFQFNIPQTRVREHLKLLKVSCFGTLDDAGDQSPSPGVAWSRCPVRTSAPHPPARVTWGEGGEERGPYLLSPDPECKYILLFILIPDSRTLSDNKSNEAMSIMMRPGHNDHVPVYLSHVMVTQSQPRPGNPLICSRKKCNP